MRDFPAYLDLARGLPWEFEQIPSYTMQGISMPGEEVRALWARATRRGSLGGGLGLYCHIPYCASRCRYCHCFSDGPARAEEVCEHLRLLLCEMDLWGPTFANCHFTNGYVGGGTPTLLPPTGLDLLLGKVRRTFRFTPDAQFTVEATPRTASAERLAVLRAHKVERLSLGVQSLDRRVLTLANRHWQTRRMVARAYHEARDAGFPIVNADLIAGLQGQSVASFLADLRTLARMGFDSIHTYYLEPCGNPREDKVLYDKAWFERRKAMLEAIGPTLSPLGYRPIYGKTNYARRDGVGSRYAVERYLRAGSVLGLGWQAYSHLFPGTNYIHLSRHTWQESLRVGRLPPVQLHQGGLDWEMREFIVHHLRHGIDFSIFRSLFGQSPLEAFPDAFSALRKAGRLREEPGRVQAHFASQQEYLAVTLHFFPEDALSRILRPPQFPGAGPGIDVPRRSPAQSVSGKTD